MQARKNQDDLFSKADIRLVVVSEPRVSEPQDFQAPFRNCKNPIPFHALYSAQRIGGKTTHSRLLRITIPYSTPKLASASSSSAASTTRRRPCVFISSTSSKARNNRSLAAAYCSVSLRGRPWACSHWVTAFAGRKALTAKVDLRSEVTSKTNSVAGASGSSANAARWPTK